jgi:hypothetical protein
MSSRAIAQAMGDTGDTAAGGTELCLGVMSLLSWDSSNTSCALSSSSS